MNREEKINWLRRYRSQLFEVQQLTMELQELREMAVHITPYLNDMPTSKSGNSHRLERSVEKVMEQLDHSGFAADVGASNQTTGTVVWQIGLYLQDATGRAGIGSRRILYALGGWSSI